MRNLQYIVNFFLEGRIKQIEGNLFFISNILEYKIPSRYNTLKGYIGKEVILGVRPEHISINLKSDNENIFPVKVGVVEPIGSDTFVYIDFPEEFVMIVKMEGLTNLQVDENVKVSFDQKQIHFFEKEIENRIPPQEA
ncbi:MAG: TOBE domain-containing protein [Candidatus Thorarchaeota archaeon]